MDSGSHVSLGLDSSLPDSVTRLGPYLCQSLDSFTKALKAKRDAEHMLRQKGGDTDYAAIRAQIAFASAQLKVIRHLLGK